MSKFDPITQIQNDMYFSKEVVNRVSFLRENADFMTRAITHNSARFIFFKDTNPLVIRPWDERLVVATNGDNLVNIKSGLNQLPSWSETINTWCKHNESHDPKLRDNQQPGVVFLGLEDESVGAKLKEVDHLDFQGKYKGIPYFAIDLTPSVKLSEELTMQISKETGLDIAENIFFSTSRKHFLGFTSVEAALYSHGKMYLDWLDRNRFCPGCGSKVIPVHGGGKLACTNTTVVGKNETKDIYECPVKNASVSNVSFPRTDAVVITAISNVEKTKMLLSLNKRHKMAKMYSCTSGFMEPSETVEVGIKREIWEETGVVASKINIVMTQPWPFPGNLMIGCVAEVEFNGENETIHLGHDNELEDARWFDMDFVKKLVYDDQNDTETNPEGIFIPMAESIAYQLIKIVVDQSDKSKL